MNGLHHLRSRLLISKGIEPFPARGAWKRFLDYLMYGVGIFAPLALLPQIGNIYIKHEIEGISLTTWVLLCAFNVLWILYGTVHKDKPIIIAHSLFAIFNATIVVGVLMY